MAITLINRSFSGGMLSAQPFPIATTTPGSTLVVAVCLASAGGQVASITTDAGDSFPNLPFGNIPDAMDTSGAELNTYIFWLPSGIGGATMMTIISSFSFNAWIWELTADNPLQVDVAGHNNSVASGNGTTATGPALAATGAQDFYAACMTAGAIVSVDPPWTLDSHDPFSGEPIELDFGAAFLLGSGTQTPVFTQTSTGRWSVSAVAFKEFAVPPTTGNIVVRKATVPGGSGQAFNFTPSYGAPFALTDGQSNDSGALVPGTYSVAETPVPGWTTTTSSDPANIVVTAGNTTTVTFTNTAPGTIIVAKTTVPSGSPQVFNFTSDYGSPFTLIDGQSNNSGPLVAGTYSVAEAPVTGWTTTVSQNPAAIVVTPGSAVTVTFTNTATPGHIITTKVMVPPSSQRFTFNPSWGNAFTLGNGESNDSGPLAPGTYTISELPVDGWTTTAAPNPANLTVVDGQTTAVTFTNTSSISGPPPVCDTPISTLAENVLNRLEEKFNVS